MQWIRVHALSKHVLLSFEDACKVLLSFAIAATSSPPGDGDISEELGSCSVSQCVEMALAALAPYRAIQVVGSAAKMLEKEGRAVNKNSFYFDSANERSVRRPTALTRLSLGKMALAKPRYWPA